MWFWIMLAFHVAGLVSSVHAVMTTRTTQGAIAWAIGLNTMPYVAVPAYWVLGRSRFQGYVTSRQGADSELRNVAVEAAKTVAPYREPPEQVSQAGRAAEKLVDIPFLNGNSVELLVDGDATFASILAGIDAAQHYILFQFFIVHDDRIGRDVKDHLIAKAKEGVKVYFLYD